MKFLEKTMLTPVCLGIQSTSGKLPEFYQGTATHETFAHQHKSPIAGFKQALRQLYHLICSISPRIAPKNFVRTRIPVNRSTDPDISEIQNDTSLRWVKTGQSHRYFVSSAINHLKDDCQPLAEQSVLCIGGRAALYPDYHRLIEAAGGKFMAFRSGAQANTNCLIALLDYVSIVICPADCINHEDFFTVRRYCQRTRKNCVILERSDLATFRKAVEILVKDYYSQPDQSASSSLSAT